MLENLNAAQEILKAGKPEGAEACQEIEMSTEQAEMANTHEEMPDAAMLREQQEMDQDLEVSEAEQEESLGEYRLFCDTRPIVSRYSMFCMRRR